MTTIKELVGRFADNANYDNWDHAVAREWMRATRSDEVDVRVITEPKESLTTAKQQQRERIREETLSFVRRYFDDRPDVVRALDELFAEFGMVLRESEYRGTSSLESAESIARAVAEDTDSDLVRSYADLIGTLRKQSDEIKE